MRVSDHAEFVRYEGPQLRPLAVPTTFMARCSALDLMIRCNGGEMEDMRGQFLHDLLRMGIALPDRGKDANEQMYRRSYNIRLDVSENLKVMREHAAENPDGPVSRFMQLHDAIDAVPALARSPKRPSIWRIKIEPEDRRTEGKEHPDGALDLSERDTGRTRLVSKNTSGTRRATAKTRFRMKTESGGSARLVCPGEHAIAIIPSSHRGSTYGAAAAAMGAEAATETGHYVHHAALPVSIEGEEEPLAGDAWTITVVCDRIGLSRQAQLKYIEVHTEMMSRFGITPAMLEKPWHFVPPPVEQIVLGVGRICLATPRGVGGGRPRIELTEQQIRSVWHLPRKEAADALNVSESTLKRISRKLESSLGEKIAKRTYSRERTNYSRQRIELTELQINSVSHLTRPEAAKALRVSETTLRRKSKEKGLWKRRD